MKKLSLLLIAAALLSYGLISCAQDVQTPKEPEDDTGPSDEAVEVYVFAAASLTDALDEIAAEYKKESNAVLNFNYAGSGTLQKQIQEGAPCDLFISASKEHMDTVEEQGLIDVDSRMNLLGNSLTLIATPEKADVVTDENSFTKAEVESIAIGTPESVPAGKYAQEALANMGIWDQIQDKIVLAKDVRQVLQYVDTGNADCGLVYRTDALLAESAKIVCDMPEDAHSEILYPAALTTNAAQPESAAAFYAFLQGDYAKGVFEKYGFTVL